MRSITAGGPSTSGGMTGDTRPVIISSTRPSDPESRTGRRWYPEHPIKDEEYEIVYILNGWGLKEDFVVLGIRRVEDGEREK